MKRFMVLFAIAFLTMGMKPNTTNLYSIDQYDGYEQYVRGGHNNLILDNKLLIIGGGAGGEEAKSFVTFDISQINLSQAKSVELQIQQVTYNVNFHVHGSFLEIADSDYGHWQNCRIDQFAGWQRTILKRTPEDCGFAKDLPTDTWYETIRYEVVGESFRVKREVSSQLCRSDNLLPAIKQYYNNKKYLTIGLDGYWPTRTNRQWNIEFVDGNPKNDDNRPKLVVTY